MGDLERVSKVVLTDEELAAKLRADGAADDEIDAALLKKADARMRAQARYDKAPPKYYKPVPQK